MDLHDFSYDELPNANEYIRLLMVLAAEDGQTVQCSMFACPKVAAPKYIAVSYTWGHPTSTAIIKLNGKRTQVRRNCEDVLLQAYRHDRNQYYWVDALCINQQNLEEKSDQVAAMGSVYANAIRVLACVGPAFRDSEIFFDILTQRTEMLNSACQTVKDNFENRSISVISYNDLRSLPEISRCRLRISVDMWLFSLDEETFRRICKGLSYLFGREYFTRVWIVQEVFMASRVIICCGNHYTSVESLVGLICIVRRAFSSLQQRRISTRSLRGLLNDGIWGDLKRVEETLLSGPATAILRFAIDINDHRFDVDALLDLMSKLSCEDPRDKIYACLGLVDWKGSPPFRPDYTKNNWEVAFDLLRMFPNRNSHHRHDERGVHARISSPLLMADKLVKCFGYGLPKEDVLSNTQNRYAKAPQLSTLVRNMRVDDPVGCQHFVAYQIGPDERGSRSSQIGLVRTTQTMSHDSSSVVNSTTRSSGRRNVYIRNASIYVSGSPKAMARVNTSVRAGDWLLVWGRFNFVAREARLDELHLISYAIFKSGASLKETIETVFSPASLPTWVTVWMDPYDLMKYAVLMHSFDSRLEQEDQVDEVFDAVFTDSPARLYKSSFAVWKRNEI